MRTKTPSRSRLGEGYDRKQSERRPSAPYCTHTTPATGRPRPHRGTTDATNPRAAGALVRYLTDPAIEADIRAFVDAAPDERGQPREDSSPTGHR